MNTEQLAVRLDNSLFAPATLDAEEQREFLESSEAHRLRSVEPVSGEASLDEDSLLLDLVVRHFHDVGMTPTEQRQVATAMLAVIDRGEPLEVGPVGRMHRQYRLTRRVNAVRIRVGEGAVSLPLVQAVRLAVLLQGDDRLQMTPSPAADWATRG